jgi:hypothetical protein
MGNPISGEPDIFPAGNMPLSGPMVFTFISSLEMREVVSGDSRFNACLTKVRLEETVHRLREKVDKVEIISADVGISNKHLVLMKSKEVYGTTHGEYRSATFRQEDSIQELPGGILYLMSEYF